jgi:hypothetical protein
MTEKKTYHELTEEQWQWVHTNPGYEIWQAQHVYETQHDPHDTEDGSDFQREANEWVYELTRFIIEQARESRQQIKCYRPIISHHHMNVNPILDMLKMMLPGAQIISMVPPQDGPVIASVHVIGYSYALN